MEIITYIIPLVLLFLLTAVFLIKRIIKLIRNFDLRTGKESRTDQFTEFLFVYLCPGVGIYITNEACDIHPFALESLLTATCSWLIFAIAYASSKFYKKRLSPLVLLLVSTALIFGVLFCAAICYHFSALYFFGGLPVLNLIYFSPLFCLLYLLRELYNLGNYLRECFESTKNASHTSLNSFYKWLERYHLGFCIYLLAPFTALVQAGLYLFGQKPDSLISQFTDSCGYLLSYQQACSCGGDHYLCSIAANGNKELVKPVRMGLRQNEKILVNRQLLIANAFENWLEEHTPNFHKVIRKAYDDCKIPVNAWAKHKRSANVLYIFMKPLEWLFLSWLYLLDTHPEDRIARQYLPKQELDFYIINKKK